MTVMGLSLSPVAGMKPVAWIWVRLLSFTFFGSNRSLGPWADWRIRQSFNLRQPIFRESVPARRQRDNATDDCAVGVHVAADRSRRGYCFTEVVEMFGCGPHGERNRIWTSHP